MTQRLKNKRRNNLLIYQSEAFNHYEGICCPTGPGEPSPPSPPCRSELGCPICGLVYPSNEFSEDHCPQISGQSRFGPASCVVLVCKGCNTDEAGGQYESKAALIKKGDHESKQNVAYVSMEASGLVAVHGMDDSNRTATDCKTAFLIAFAVLGYRFAMAPALREVREAIMAGKMPSVSGAMLTIQQDKYKANTVYEFENGFVYVIGQDYGWNFYAGSEPTVPEPAEQPAHVREWPETHSSGSNSQLAGYFNDGRIFHLDSCRAHKHTWVPDPISRTERSLWTR